VGATVPGTAPASAPAHLQFSSTPIGTPIFLMYNFCRLPGQIIWAPGIDATNSVLDTSLLTFAACYGEPIDPTESIEIKTMSANGTLFYDINAGGVQTVANITSADMAQLSTCISNMEIYLGGETQLPSPTMESYIGVGSVPAYRGLRYIVFTDFPLSISGNAVPNIVIEWGPPSNATVNVSDIMVKLIERVTWRTQYLQAKADNIVGTPTVSGIDDTCYGLTITSTGSLIDHLNNHRLVYNFQIKEGDPVAILRRPVGGSLVIDYQVNEANLIGDASTPAMTTARPNPIDFPVAMNLTFFDPFQGYDSKIAPAVFDGSQPGRNTSISSTVLQASMEYVVDSTTARTLAFTAMFNMRSFSAAARFSMDELTAEVGDTVAVTTSNGDINVFLVSQQAITKNRANQIQGIQLLTQGGVGINGADSLSGGTLGKLLWPDQCMPGCGMGDMVFDAVNGKVWTAGSDTFAPPTSDGSTAGAFDPYINTVCRNNFPPPFRRKISTANFCNITNVVLASTGDQWSDGASLIGSIWADTTYVYYVGWGPFVLRYRKDAVDIHSPTIPDVLGMGPDPFHGDFVLLGTTFFDDRDSKLYIQWVKTYDPWLGTSSGYPICVIVDLAAWSSTAWSAFSPTYGSYVPTGTVGGICITANNLIVMIVSHSSTDCRIYYANKSNPTSWGYVTSSKALRINTPCVSGNTIFAVQDNLTEDGTEATAGKYAGIIDCSSGTPVLTLVDLTARDPNIACLSQAKDNAGCAAHWTSGSHVYIACNDVRHSGNYPAGFEIGIRPYLARFDLTLNNPTGKFVSDIFPDDREFSPSRGHYEPTTGVNFICGCFPGRSESFIVQTGEDLSSPVVWPNAINPVPPNNNFSNAIALSVGGSYSGNQFYGSTEVGEPVPAYATSGSDAYLLNNGHSVWFKFVAPSTVTYTVTTDRTAGSSNNNGGIVIYTGSSLATLVHVADSASSSGGIVNLSFSATAATTYMISIRLENNFNIGANEDTNFEHYGNYKVSIA
jgi:hypothetical protein